MARAKQSHEDTASNYKILLVEDSCDYRLALRLHLEDVGYNIVESAHTVEALEKAAEARPSAAIVDIIIPPNARQPADHRQSEGLAAARRLKQLDPNIGIVIFSRMMNRRAEVSQMFQTMRGIVYLVKGIPTYDALDEAIRRAIRGDVWIDPQVELIEEGRLAHFLLDLCSPIERKHIHWALEAWDSLTPTEILVLEKVAQAYSVQETANRLNVKKGTIEAHINNIYSKMLSGIDSKIGLRKQVLLAKIYQIHYLQSVGK